MKRHTTFKLTLRLVLLGAVVLTVAGFTTALWSDGAISTGNVFATGSLDLKVRPDGGEFWVDGPVYATWGATNMYPGQELNWGAISFKDCGTLDGSTFDICVSNTCSVSGMDEYVQITRMEYTDGIEYNFLDSGASYGVVDLNHNGWIDLDDLEHHPCLGLTPPGTSGELLMDFRFNENAGNDYAGGEFVTADFTFTLHQ